MKMMRKYQKHSWRVGILAALSPCWTAMAFAAQKPASATGEGSPLQQAGPAEVDASRGSLDRFLDEHPEIQDDVLGDPQRIADPRFVQDHPELQIFMESHPLVKADPRAFVSSRTWRFTQRRGAMEELLGWFIPFSVFICCLLAALWLIRTLLENRRWSKSFKIHEDVHTKLIEKFSSGQDLTAYMESEAGRKLLDWTPPSIEGRMPFAASRILWSLQAGLILGLAGFGLLESRAYVPDATEPLLVFGVLGLTIGIGFVLSAILSYAISRHLGLLGAGASGDAKPGLMPTGH